MNRNSQTGIYLLVFFNTNSSIIIAININTKMVIVQINQRLFIIPPPVSTPLVWKI